MNDGTAAVYLADDDGEPTIAFVVRVDRLGWAIDQIKGIGNVELDAVKRQECEDIFRSVGVASSGDISCIKNIVFERRWCS
jgi:hypothetical protein